METYFDRHWEEIQKECPGVDKEVARKLFEGGRSLTRNQFVIVAYEMLTREQTKPTQAILHALQYAGFELELELTYDAMKAEVARQYEEAFGTRKSEKCETQSGQQSGSQSPAGPSSSSTT